MKKPIEFSNEDNVFLQYHACELVALSTLRYFSLHLIHDLKHNSAVYITLLVETRNLGFASSALTQDTF